MDLIYFISYLLLLVPFAFLLFMPGKKTLFIATMIFLLHGIDSHQKWPEMTREKLSIDTNEYITLTVFALGVIIRSILLWRKRYKSEKPPAFWTWKENVVLMAFVVWVISSQMWWSSGICYSEMRVLSKKEITERVLWGEDYHELADAEQDIRREQRVELGDYYYKIEEADRHIFGPKRYLVTSNNSFSNPFWQNYIKPCGQNMYKGNKRKYYKPEELEKIKDEFVNRRDL